MSSEEEETQLHNDEGVLVNRKRKRCNDAAKKLEAVKWAKEKSIRSAAKRFDVDRHQIKRWKKDERQLQRQM
jgi:transposase